MATHDLDAWVNQRMAAANPPAEWPDAASGRARLDQRLARRTPPRLVWAAATAVLLASVVALPGPRAAAQRLWDRTVLGRIQVLLVDGERAGLFEPDIYQRPDTQPVSSLEEAAEKAGFLARLPASGVFSVSPTYSVASVTAARIRVDGPALRYLSERAGGSAADVPRSWDGAVLEFRIGPVIIADYDGVLLLQSLPFDLITPPDFDLGLFYRSAFQSMGMSEADAWARSADLRISPALLMAMPGEEADLVREFRARSGNGVMIDEVYGDGKTVAVWSGSDRVYALFPSTRDVSRDFIAKVANVLD